MYINLFAISTMLDLTFENFKRKNYYKIGLLYNKKKAVNKVEEMFLGFKSYFREQPILDYGVDAIVETSLNNKPSGSIHSMLNQE